VTGAPDTSTRWDLGSLYEGPDDPRIPSDLADVRRRISEFRAAYAGRVGTLEAPALAAALAEMEVPYNMAERLAGYAWMAFYTDTRDEAARTLYQSIWGEYTLLLADFEFFKQELKYLEPARFDALLADPALAGYRYWLERIRRWAPHTLPEAEEGLVARKSLTGEQAWGQLYTEITAALRVPVELEDGPRRLTLSETRALRPSPDRRLRRDAHLGTLQAYAGERHLLSYVFNTLFQDHLAMLEVRGLDDLMSPVLLEHDVERSVVDALLRTTAEHHGLAQRYYRAKAAALGLDDFSVYDVFAPYPAARTEVPFGQAREMVLDALSGFHPGFGRIAAGFFEGGYIDAHPRPGKPQGAFCFGLGPTVHPFIFMNYGGALADVVTLAHELGHGIHYVKAAERQSVMNTYTVPPMLETVSIFSEMVMFQRLLERERDPAIRLQLLASQLEGFIFNVHRQATMTAWELSAYEARKAGEVTPEAFGQLWLEANRAFYGDAVALTEWDAWGWAMNPFFVSQRFINYAYCFGQLLVYSLYQQYREQGDAFLARYEAMLEVGGAASPRELLARLDVDIADPGFWRRAFGLFEDLLGQFEAAIADREAEPAR
jgi:oligoendopeptidase F